MPMRALERKDSGDSGDRRGRGAENALSHGGSPRQKEPGETGRAGCSQSFGTLTVGSRHGGAQGGHHDPRGEHFFSPEQCPRKRSQLTWCHLKEGLSTQA